MSENSFASILNCLKYSLLLSGRFYRRIALQSHLNKAKGRALN